MHVQMNAQKIKKKNKKKEKSLFQYNVIVFQINIV